MVNEIILVAVVIVLIFLGLGGILHMMYRQEDKKRRFELQKESKKAISPIRVRAYERLSLLLERTQPEHMLVDKDLIHTTITELEQDLLQTIRLEFDHNMSQQIYVSDEVWHTIMMARDEMAAFVTAMAHQMQEGSTALDYAKVMVTAYHNNGDTPHEIALDQLKKEARTLVCE